MYIIQQKTKGLLAVAQGRASLVRKGELISPAALYVAGMKSAIIAT